MIRYSCTFDYYGDYHMQDNFSFLSKKKISLDDFKDRIIKVLYKGGVDHFYDCFCKDNPGFMIDDGCDCDDDVVLYFD